MLRALLVAAPALFLSPTASAEPDHLERRPRMTRLLAVVVCLGLMVLGCTQSETYEMTVTAYPNPDAEVVAGQHFATVVIGQTRGGELLEKNLLALVRKEMEEKGFVYDKQSQELLVALTGFIGPRENYVPPSTIYWPMPTRSSSSTTGSAYGSGGYAIGWAPTTTQGTQWVPVTRPGYTRVDYYRRLDVLVGQLVTEADSNRVDLMWTGTVESAGYAGDLLEVAPVLVNELFTEFPKRSGKGSTRTRYGP